MIGRWWFWGFTAGAQQAGEQPQLAANTHLLNNAGVDHWWLVRACRAQVAEQGTLGLWGAKVSMTVPWHRSIYHQRVV